MIRPQTVDADADGGPAALFVAEPGLHAVVQRPRRAQLPRPLAEPPGSAAEFRRPLAQLLRSEAKFKFMRSLKLESLNTWLTWLVSKE